MKENTRNIIDDVDYSFKTDEADTILSDITESSTTDSLNIELMSFKRETTETNNNTTKIAISDLSTKPMELLTKTPDFLLKIKDSSTLNSLSNISINKTLEEYKTSSYSTKNEGKKF